MKTEDEIMDEIILRDYYHPNIQVKNFNQFERTYSRKDLYEFIKKAMREFAQQQAQNFLQPDVIKSVCEHIEDPHDLNDVIRCIKCGKVLEHV